MKGLRSTIRSYVRRAAGAGFLFFFVFPASTNYQLRDFGIGGGGAGNATSGSYAITGIAGETDAGKLTGSTYNLGAGLIFTNQADVPPAPTFTNPSNYYNKLHFVLAVGGNPTDTKFAIAISSDNWTTTNYVQSDDTVGATLSSGNYLTAASWGASFDIIGLTANTTYKVKVKAMQGKFTETGFGPEASAATINPTMSFGITTDTQSSPPFSVDFGNMVPNTVNTSPHQVNVTLTTNGANGARVYVTGANVGLHSAMASHTIAAVSGNLSVLSEGFGAQGISATQTSGGPFTIATLYNQGGNTVGITDTTVRDIFDVAGPVVGGAGSFNLKAKPSATAPSASDYSETLTVIASASF